MLRPKLMAIQPIYILPLVAFPFMFACERAGADEQRPAKGGDRAKAPDRCLQAFKQLESVHGGFGGNTYAGREAVRFGVVCNSMSDAEVACVEQAKTKDAARECAERSRTVVVEKARVWKSQGAGDDTSAETAMYDMICKCKTIECLVGVAASSADQIVRASTREWRAVERRIDKCVSGVK